MTKKSKRADINDISDPKSVERLEKMNEMEQLQREEEFRFLLKQKQFRSWLYRLMQSCGMDDSSFTGNSTTFKNEGAREVQINLKMEVWKANFKAWLQMEEEYFKDNIVKKERINV